jgi:hypothetical protein
MSAFLKGGERVGRQVISPLGEVVQPVIKTLRGNMLMEGKQIQCLLLFASAWLTAICMTGCAVIPDYPSQFPPLVSMVENTGPRTSLDRLFIPHQLECSEIAGRYSDKGIAITPNGNSLGPVSLTRILHERRNPIVASPETADTIVVIGPEQDVLKIQSWKGSMQVAALEQSSIDKTNYTEFETHYYCEPRGFIILTRSHSGGASQIGVASGGDYLRLRKAVDGSLIVYHHAGGGGLIFIIPFWYTTQNVWYRFPLVVEGIQHSP